MFKLLLLYKIIPLFLFQNYTPSLKRDRTHPLKLNNRMHKRRTQEREVYFLLFNSHFPFSPCFSPRRLPSISLSRLFLPVTESVLAFSQHKSIISPCFLFIRIANDGGPVFPPFAPTFGPLLHGQFIDFEWSFESRGSEFCSSRVTCTCTCVCTRRCT